jgi:murein DD-endopeptidase MepM/ murein hydrolase activator NlpD
MSQVRVGLILVLLWVACWWPPVRVGAEMEGQHLAQPGDTWEALAWRYGRDPEQLRAANPHPNRQRQPAIGRVVRLPVATAATVAPVMGVIRRANNGGLLATAVAANRSPWYLALLNDDPGLGPATPYRPLLYRPLFVPGGSEPVREWPVGFHSLELSAIPAHAGKALALRAQTEGIVSATAVLNDQPFTSFAVPNHLVSLGGVGAFYPTGDHELLITPAGQPAWAQPWAMVEREWSYQQLTLTGAAAAIDAASIAAERARLFALWSQVTAVPQWDAPFTLPIRNYLSISSDYGVRRSYNGGPYRTYHEGVDFSAYGGTPVIAPAAGTVVVAEFLYVRGGAVILDHGLGIYSGYYHMSEVLAEVGDRVPAGQIVGAVGTTGLSTGNHLHWDLLVNGTWIDAAAWLEDDMACWILAGLGRSCAP